MSTLNVRVLGDFKPTTLELETIKGEVIDLQQSSSTSVSSQQSVTDAVINSNPNSRVVSVPDIKSRTTNIDQVFVRSEDGAETVAKIANNDVAVRIGSHVSLVYVKKQGDKYERKLLVVMANHDSGKVGQLGSANRIRKIFDIDGNSIVFLASCVVFALVGKSMYGYWIAAFPGFIAGGLIGWAAVWPSAFWTEIKIQKYLAKQIQALQTAGKSA